MTKDMMTLEQAQKLGALTQDDVVSVYSGKPGCACGCRGKHSYAKQYQTLASKNRGYAVDDDEISDRNVKRILHLMQAHVDQVRYIEDGIFVYDLHENRTYTLYTTEYYTA